MCELHIIEIFFDMIIITRFVLYVNFFLTKLYIIKQIVYCQIQNDLKNVFSLYKIVLYFFLQLSILADCSPGKCSVLLLLFPTCVCPIPASYGGKHDHIPLILKVFSYKSQTS